MSPVNRRLILRANAVFLLAASAGGMYTDILGAFFQRGHVAPVLATRRMPPSASWRRMGWHSSSASCCGVPSPRAPGI